MALVGVAAAVIAGIVGGLLTIFLRPTMGSLFGVGAVIVGTFAGFILSFVSGLIFLPETSLLGALGFVAFLGLVGGSAGGYVARVGWRETAAIGLLGGLIFLAIQSGLILEFQYNPVRTLMTPWELLLRGGVFVAAAGCGGVVGRYLRVLGG